MPGAQPALSVQPLRVQKLRPNATLPRRMEQGAGGYDLYACGGQSGRLISTGMAVEIPEGWVGLIRDRSSIATAGRGYTVAGVIDSSYRGEIKVVFDRHITVEDGERIAQLVIVPHFTGQVMEATELSATRRGASGFGSTGKGG